jgi:hypothetical protein
MRVRATLCFIALMLVGVALPNTLRAEAPAQHTAFAVVIGNNRSLDGRRPDLHYADDDAAKYFDIFRTIAQEHVFLLADFDRDTARLFPDAGAHAAAPTRGELLRVGRQLADEVREVTSQGGAADVYFVFAGHGDVDEGRGFIELADARFTSSDLERWLHAIPFSRGHVILDSCNSFFMLATRKPGGRYYATSDDAARSLGARLPNVGVFLSTSAEGDAFEWSELQSGVFSHIVRSGLLGAADANGDSRIDYLELAAFVATATADVANPNMRPHVFARGPGGRDDMAIVETTGRRGARTLHVAANARSRIRLRDREGIPFLDANTESGLATALAIPESWASGAVLERALPGSPAEQQLFALPDGQPELSLASLSPSVARGTPRGPAEIFEKLFAQPFGPHALASYQSQLTAATAPVFGVSREDAERMNLLLGQIESAEHDQRMRSGAMYLAVAGYYGLLGGSTLAFGTSLPNTSREEANIVGGVILGMGALSVALGVYTLARPWVGERLAMDYRAALGTGGEYARAFALADDKIHDLAASEARTRWIQGIAGGVLVVLSTAWIVGTELDSASDQTRLEVRLAGGFGVLLGLGAIATACLIESPIQRLTTLWQRDPGHFHLEPTLAAAPGGGMVGVNGRF